MEEVRNKKEGSRVRKNLSTSGLAGRIFILFPSSFILVFLFLFPRFQEGEPIRILRLYQGYALINAGLAQRLRIGQELLVKRESAAGYEHVGLVEVIRVDGERTAVAPKAGKLARSLEVGDRVFLSEELFRKQTEGFGSLPWGADTSRVERLFYVMDDTSAISIKLYQRQGDDLNFYGVSLDEILYGFWQGKLFEVKLLFSGLRNHDMLRTWCRNQFGIPAQPDPEAEEYFWFGSLTVRHFKYNRLAAQGVLIFTSREMGKRAGKYGR